MCKTLFWMVIISWIMLAISILKSGGNFVPRVEYLEERSQTLYDMIIDNKNEQEEQIEIMRCQLAQIRPDVKRRHNR